jgi:diguanylate cyclase (GGDEF)-like protein
MNLSIRAQIRLLVTLLAVGFGLCVLTTFRVLANRQVDQTIHADGEAVQSALRMFVRGRGGLQKKLTHFLATSPRVTMLTQADNKTAADAIEGLRDNAGVDGILLLGSNGNLMAASGVKDVREVQAAVKKKLVAKVLDGQSGQAIVEADGDPMLVTAEPLRIDTYVKGAVLTFLRMDGAMAKTIGNNVRGNIGFYHDGRILGASLPIKGLTIDESAATQTLTIQGQPYVAQLAPMPDTPSSEHLGVVTLRSVEDATATYRELTSAFMTVLLVVTLVAMFGGTALTQYFTRPLDAVVEAARVLQRGEWPERLNSKRKDEIGLLQRVFDDMSTSMQGAQAKLLAMIDKDPLTELDNHRALKQRLDQESYRAASTGENLALVLIDLDDFSGYNDDRGHEAGDQLLKDVASTIRENSPELSVVSRYGADTFAVLLPGMDAEATEDLADTLLAALRAQGASVSVGGAQFHLHAKEAAGLTLAAELALGRAQQLGGNQTATFDAVRGTNENADPYQVSRFLQDASFATIQALAAAVDAKDPYTKGHSLRVAEMARDLCAYLGGSKDEVDRIYRAGTLHDVGKIGVPDSILKKPSRLEEEERRLMETHPALGEIIVRKVPQLEDLLPGVRHHHEKFDGTGYPDGLAGAGIPRMARLLAVADTYDAMTSDRPYRKGLAVEIALTEIAKGAGTQFDPEMAEAFCKMIRASVAIAA